MRVSKLLRELVTEVAILASQNGGEKHELFLDSFSRLVQRLAAMWEKYESRFGSEL